MAEATPAGESVKIAFIAAGAGGMYCGSCIRDNALARELMDLGHEVTLMPIYTPMRTDEEAVALDRVFYGAVSIYLEQKFSWFARVPRWLRGWLDNPALLRRIPMSSSATDARELGEITLSTLRGEEGKQQAELRHLARWLAEHEQPQIVQLTNSMLLGFAREIRAALPEAKIVCALQGEDIFLQDLTPEYRERVIAVMRERARDVDLFVSTSEFYREPMADLLEVDLQRIAVAPIGIRPPESPGHDETGEVEDQVFTVGYLARICPEKGLHVLADAFRLLAERVGADRVRLRVAGYLGGRDKRYAEDVRRQLEQAGLGSRLDWVGEVDRNEKTAFLRSLDVFSVPTTYREPKGLSILEAMAEGVAVVQPQHGAFPEMLEATGGGLLVPPEDPESLAQHLQRLMDAPEERVQLGQAGRSGVREHYTTRVMAEKTAAVYNRLLGEGGSMASAAGLSA